MGDLSCNISEEKLTCHGVPDEGLRPALGVKVLARLSCMKVRPERSSWDEPLALVYFAGGDFGDHLSPFGDRRASVLHEGAAQRRPRPQCQLHDLINQLLHAEVRASAPMAAGSSGRRSALTGSVSPNPRLEPVWRVATADRVLLDDAPYPSGLTRARE